MPTPPSSPFAQLFGWATKPRKETLLGKGFRRPLSLVLKALFKIWWLFKLIVLNRYVRCGAIILRTIWPSVLVLVLGYLFLNLMDQSRDLLDTLIQDFWYSFWAFAFLLLFGLAAWYFTRILFILKDQVSFVEIEGEDSEIAKGKPKNDPGPGKEIREKISEENSEIADVLQYKESGKWWIKRNLDHFSLIDATTLRMFTKWTPLALGFTPFASLLLALSKVEGTGRHIVVLVLMSLVYLAIAYRVKNYVNGHAADHTNILRHVYGELKRVHQFIIAGSFIAIFLLIFLAANWYTNLGVSRFIGPVAILFMALTMWMFIASVFTYLDYHFQAPFTLICLILTLFLDNNNHQIRTLEPESATMPGNYSSKTTSAQPVAGYFSNWLDHRLAQRDSTRTDSLTYPVYLIATEGGGIRSAYWTAAVLNTLEQAHPGFFNHVFAISGVSGGSVGAAVYTARYRDLLRRKDFDMDLHGYFAKDFLSPLLTAFLIPDLLQKFSPVPINGFDRAQYLEDSWAEAYREMQPEQDVKSYETLDQPFLSLWDEKLLNENCPTGRCRSRYDLPVLLLNATQVETGQKGILTPLRIEGNENFKNVIDIQEKIYRHISLKTAASISARFPVVTPPATIRVINDPSKDAANFVDGGYFDNSGTTTLLSILSSITKGIENKDSILTRAVKKARVEFRVLFLKNSPETSASDGQAASINGMYELKAPLQAFFKSWDNSWDSKEFVMREYLRGFSNDQCKNNKNHFPIDKQLYTFVLDRKTGVLPLGWDLSKGAEARIREQADGLLRVGHDTARNANLARLFVGVRPPSASGPKPGAAQNPAAQPALAKR
ncbi:MAG: patatin-like phospholipase family protein [Cytophagaceae bacterium]|nr:patatin-like phospholipase family protein [Cytophagaceae bacterium]